MSAETTLKSLINAIAIGGCYNGINNSGDVVVPYVVFHEISGMPLNTITTYSGRTECRFQVDVFAKSPEHAKGLALGDIKDAITSSPILQGELVLQMKGQYSESDKAFQYITEYVIWTD